MAKSGTNAMLIQNTIAGYDDGALTMVKNTPTATTATVQPTVSGTVAAISTPLTAPRIVAGIRTIARRVDSPADPAMMTNAVQATTRL